MKAVHLVSWFLTGCIASTTLTWSASLHPVLFRPVVFLWLIVAAAWVAFLILDDAVLGYLGRISLLEYRGVLIACLLALLIGLSVGVAICYQTI